MHLTEAQRARAIAKLEENWSLSEVAAELNDNKTVHINESCFFTEQCEAVNHQTECKEGLCTCRFGKVATLKQDGQLECTIG
ncbi:hypothetical protein NQ317_017496 [Molorchus minor]|uniref:EB domain-containing protein n=1 Tax=Molorchus minor TaxID=1323400 RepID=A0ABQ9IRD8_9CUCU|nr:hypothetical protein NQ317_017496 [Molorchus minor]